MTDHAVIKAEYSDYRRVKGRKVIQLVCEVPIEQAATVHERLGEPGAHDKQIWVAIALLNETGQAKEAPKEKRRFEDMKPSQQAALLCKDPEFWAYIEYRSKTDSYGAREIASEEAAAEWVRYRCYITSRSELDEEGPPQNDWWHLRNHFGKWRLENRYAGTPALEKQK